jgi:hypothetical protein
MFEQFSGGYYLGRLYVRPSGDERALMDLHQHERLNEHLYASGEGVERLDAPLVMKLDDAHFPVHGDEGVPADTLSVPEDLLVDRVRDPPALREVLLAKGDRARQLLEMTAGYEAPEVT